MPRPVIALLTDFGTADHYVGAMKGVLLGICPEATLVDITHEIAPHDILGAALELAAAYRAFPAGTVFLVVVDPGVGSARRGLAAVSAGYTFVAPDNGVLTAVVGDSPPTRVIALAERRYARQVVSPTFEGRDRFAPAAAWLATGLDADALGPPVTDFVRLAVPAPAVRAGHVAGEVLRIDRFGNLVSNIDRQAWARAVGPGRPDITVGDHRVGPLVDTYAEIGRSEIGALFGSSDHLELAAREKSAAMLLDVRRGAAVVVRWVAKGTDPDGL